MLWLVREKKFWILHSSWASCPTTFDLTSDHSVIYETEIFHTQKKIKLYFVLKRSFIHSFKYLLSVYDMLCTVLSARDIEVNKTHKNIYQKAGGDRK